MRTVAVTPNELDVVVDFHRELKEPRSHMRTLGRIYNVERINSVSSLVENAEAGRQFVLVTMDGGRPLGVLTAEHRVWDSGFFDLSVMHVGLSVGDLCHAERELVAHELLSRCLAHLCPVRHYLVAEVGLSDVASFRALQKAGFGYLVPMAVLGREPISKANLGRSSEENNVEIEPWVMSDLDELKALARSAFAHSRFHLEPGLSFDIANELHAEWVRNCCITDLADQVVVARCEDHIAGFAALKVKPVGTLRLGSIVLVATHPEFRGIGVGTRLVRSATEWFEGRADYLSVRTEMTNLGAIAMYHRVGYEIEVETVCLSLWLN